MPVAAATPPPNATPALHRSWVEVSRSQIAANYREVCRAAGAGVTVMPVVKADAYRHGAVAVSHVLEAEGARWLAVSNVDEGVTLREAGCQSRILVMADFLPFERPALVEHSLTPVIHDLRGIAEWAEMARAHGRKLAYHLKIDSGMGRLGTREPAVRIAEAVHASEDAAELEGLMTHFASSADFDSHQTTSQIETFHAVYGALRTAGIRPRHTHMGSTNVLAYPRPRASGDLVRPGHAIYGYVSQAKGASAPPLQMQVKPALSWKAAVLAVKDVEAGALIGYGGMHRAAAPSRIAILAAGYADGIPHRLGGRGRVIVRGCYAPVAGAVSMDVTTIDVTHCPPIAPGESVTIVGSEGDASIDAQQIAKLAGTISYSVLCGIHARVKRVYV